MKTSKRSGLTYRDSGVDIDRARQAKQRIKELARSTFNDAVIGEIGAFAGQYRPDLRDVQKPVLVSSADGVGTKLKIAFLTGIHNTVGIDLVAHCTNDILVQRAFPLFFLDYIGTGELEPQIIEQIVEGLARGCSQSECALLGGETAEMPDFYQKGEYDLVGFIVGLADEKGPAEASPMEAGDILIGLPSSGLHTNGYSLVRKLFFEQEGLQVESYLPELGRTVAEELLIPHRNYLPPLKELLQTNELRALAHITGGGITDNLARVLGEGFDARIDRDSWEIPPIFRLIQERGRVDTDEMYRTFNMGVGMILIVAQARSKQVLDSLSGRGEAFYLMGSLVEGHGRVRYK